MSPELRLQQTAQAMISADRHSVTAVLKRQCPRVYRQILRDGQSPKLLSLWGRSVNVDENVGEVIVHPAILRAIGELAGVPMRGRIVHAGLQHTYGYLFSLIETPYGMKRDRWVSSNLERGFGVDESLFGDRPRHGTLLANLTWFLGHIVFRGRELQALQRHAVAAAPELVRYDFGRLSLCRIVERTTLPGSGQEIKLFTDLVSFPIPPAQVGDDDTLLIYSVQRGARSRIKLITAFPVSPRTVESLRASVTPGKVQVRLRYNAYVRGLFGRTLPGRRGLVQRPSGQIDG